MLQTDFSYNESAFWGARKFRVYFSEIEIRILSALFHGSSWIRDPYLHNPNRHGGGADGNLCDCVYRITPEDLEILESRIVSTE